MRCLTVIGLMVMFASPALAQHAAGAHHEHGASPSREVRTTAALPNTSVRAGAKKRAGAKQAARFNHRRISERQGFKKVSSLVNFPSFFPGIGALYVKPDTLPNGPFRAYDRQDRLVSTIYMIPIEDIEQKKSFGLGAVAGKGDHVTMYFNSGHPGVEMPHYHVVVWHVSKKDEARVAQ